MDKSIREALSAPFADADIEWRLQWTDDTNTNGLAVPYVTNRAIQNRLDSVVGIDGWKNDYIPWHSDGKKASQICGISIFFPERNEWIQKFDGAENTDIEAIKGGLSDSMKRAAVQWGIGRYLYSADGVFVQTEKRGKTTYIKASEQDKLNKAHQKVVSKIFGSQAGASPASLSKPEVLPPKEAGTQQKDQPQSSLTVPPAGQAQNVYKVVNVAFQPTMNKSRNTLLQLEGLDGRLHQVHMQGENPGLVAGVWIMDAVIKKKPKDDLVFYILESFRFMQQEAA